MSRVIRVTASEFKPIPSGFYKVRLVGITDGVSPFGPAYLFEYEVLKAMKFTDDSMPHQQRKLEGRKFRDYISESRAKNADLCKVIRALTGANLQEDDEFDLDGLIGASCYVDVRLDKKYVVKVIDYFTEEEYRVVSGS